MNTQELIESAVLDALALLDDEERAAFDRAFIAAAPELQAHIRREQTRMCQLDSVLPDVDAPAELRARVLEAVRHALGTKAEAEDARVHQSGRHIHELRRPRRVSPIWRATALGCATAAVVLAAATLHFQDRFRDLEDMLITQADIGNLVDSSGTSWADALMFGRAKAVNFVAADPTDPRFVDAQATIHLGPDGEAFLVCQYLQPAEGDMRYELVVENDTGFEVLATLEPAGRRLTEKISLKGIGTQAGTRFAIHAISRVRGELVRTVVMVTG